MADIASTDVTYTLVKQRKEDSSNKVINLTAAFGNSTLTYPSGGVPLDKAKMGVPNHIVSLSISSPASADGLIYKYDQANNKIRMYYSANHAHNVLIKGGTAVAGTDALNVKTAILGKESATDATVLGADSATKGGVISGGAAALVEVTATSYAPAATTLYIEVVGW